MQNEALNQALLLVLNKSIEAVEAGATFLQGQLPDVIQQLLLYKLVIGLIPWLFFFPLFITSIVLLKKALKVAGLKGEEETWSRKWKELDNKQDAFVAFLAASGIGSVVSLGLSLSQISAVIQIWLAPKLYLLDYAASLIRGR